jgi:hypothetical protein
MGQVVSGNGIVTQVEVGPPDMAPLVARNWIMMQVKPRTTNMTNVMASNRIMMQVKRCTTNMTDLMASNWIMMQVKRCTTNMTNVMAQNRIMMNVKAETCSVVADGVSSHWVVVKIENPVVVLGKVLEAEQAMSMGHWSSKRSSILCFWLSSTAVRICTPCNLGPK